MWMALINQAEKNKKKLSVAVATKTLGYGIEAKL